MLKQLEELKTKALGELGGISNSKELESWRVLYLGKKSSLTQILRGLAALPLEERKAVGAYANQVRDFLEDNLKQTEHALREAELATATKKEAIDST